MKRPLAVFGGAFLLCLLAAAGRPAVVLLPLGLALAAAFVVCVLVRRVRRMSLKRPRLAYFPALLLAAATAFLWQVGYNAIVVAPVRALEGSEAAATVKILSWVPDESGEVYSATLQVQALNGEAVPPFKVTLYYPGEVEIGDVAETTLRFGPFASDLYLRHAAKGVYVSASAKAPFTVTGQSIGFMDRVRLFQYGLGDAIRTRLPERLSGISAAMSVGDRRYVPYEASAAYKASGLSHVLVVSGLHLSILCGVVTFLSRRLFRGPKARSLVCMAFVLGMMALTGFTPSVVRSGVMYLLVYAAPLMYRRADVYTSLGFAAVVLCLQNPYAAADMGLLLSFTATLGALQGGKLQEWMKRRWREKDTHKPKWPLRAGRWVAASVAFTACVVVATLPVVVLYNSGVSMVALFTNMVAVPLLPVLVVTGWLMALPAVPLLDALARLAAVVNGALLRLLELVTDWCLSLPGVYQYVGGLFGLLVLVAVYGLCWFGWRYRRPLYPVFAFAVVCPLVLLLHLTLSRALVTLTVVGSSNPSVVVVQNRQAVVLYRGSNTLRQVQQVLQQQGVQDCVLLVDMRLTGQGTEYEALEPGSVVRAADLASRTGQEALENADIYVVRQGDGHIACVDVEGYTVVLSSGRVELDGYPPVDVYVAEAGGDTASRTVYGNGTQVVVRPGKSVLFREADDGTADG